MIGAPFEQRRSPIVSLLLFSNIIVFIMWPSSEGPSYDFMAQNFLVSWTALSEGRYWVLISSVFSHTMLFHILLNMLVLVNFGRIVEQVLGSVFFLQFYLFAGIVASLAHALVSLLVLENPDIPALGASGAIAGVVLVFSLLFPKERLYLFGFIPMPAILGALIFVGLDLWGLAGQARGGGLPIGHGAHLGGAFAGAFAYFTVIRRRIIRRRQWRML